MEILRFVVGVLTVLTGLVSLFWPLRIRGFTGLEVSGGRGITEIRAVLGGVFIATGGAAMLFNARETWWMLGITYLVLAVIRGIYMFIDKSVERSNVISVIVEVVFGVILVL